MGYLQSINAAQVAQISEFSG